jgi:hypothetical protein
MKITTIRDISVAALALEGLTLFLVKDSIFSLFSFGIAAFIGLMIKEEETNYIGDPVELREKFMNSSTAKQLQLTSLEDVPAANIEHESLFNRATDDKITIFYITPSSGSWVDVEVWQHNFKQGDTPLLAYYNHLVEIRSIGVLRTSIKRAYLTSGVKGALSILKQQGISGKNLSEMLDNKEKKKDAD